MLKTEKKTFQILDLYISAYFTLCGIQPELQVTNGRVIFVFPRSDDLYRLLSNYNANVNVPVADFVTTVKMLRGQMLSMRGQK
jgi:hypothetical protein